MELWEFNIFIKTREKVYINKYKENLTLAYNTGAFTANMALGKNRPKPLQEYINEIDKNNYKKSKEEIEDGINFAKEQAKKITKQMDAKRKEK